MKTTRFLTAISIMAFLLISCTDDTETINDSKNQEQSGQSDKNKDKTQPKDDDKQDLDDEDKDKDKDKDKQDPEQQDPNQQDPNQQDPNQQDPNQQDPNQQDPNQQDPNQQDPNQQDPNQQDPNQQDPNQQDPNQQDPNQQDPNQQDPNQQDPNQQDPNDGHVYLPTPKVVPEADLLDVVFANDGTASNISGSALTVKTNRSSALTTYYSPRYERFSAHFSNPLGGTASGYYRVDYGADQAVKSALSDGHSMEAVFRLDTQHSGSSEAKFFAAHQGGGTGFLISKTEKGRDITFLPHVGGDYVWCGSGIQPQVGRYYHVVGVWDKSEGQARIYVDGELKKTVAASGEFKFGSETWFGVGCDADSSGNIAWNGDVAIARVYDKPLTSDQVSALYQKVKLSDPNHFVLDNIDALGTFEASPGYKYYIYGSGFQAGDVVRFESMTTGEVWTAATTIEDGRVVAIIPDGFESGDYRSVIVRGDDVFPVTSGKITITENPSNPMNVKCVAHRGYHKDVPANSIASLKKAQELGVYGSEFDVWITLDGDVFVNHDETYGNVNIQNSKTSQVSKLKLPNGESLPTLRAYLEQGKKVPSVKLILEIKSHNSPEKNKKVTKACIDMVKELDMVDQVEWIAFSYDNCKQVSKELSGAVVQFLSSSSTKTMQSLRDDGISAIDYSSGHLAKNLKWIDEAHALGMFVNVWTVPKSEFSTWISRGVDVITTDDAADLMKMSRVYVEK